MIRVIAAVRLVGDRCIWAKPTASRSTTPLKRSGVHVGAPPSSRPSTPTASTATATRVPATLKRPALNWVDPRKAAAMAGRRKFAEILGSPVESCDAVSRPAKALRTPQVTVAPKMTPRGPHPGQPRGFGIGTGCIDPPTE